MGKRTNRSEQIARILFGNQGDVILDPMIQALTLASGLLMLGNIVMSPLLVDLARIYGVSGSRMGLTMTAYNAPTVVLMFLIGVLADRIGRKPLLITGMVLYTISGAIMALVADFSFSLLLRVLQGTGFALSTPIITTIIGDRYHGGREATAQGIRVSGNNFMSIIAPVFASSLMLISWRFPFLLFFTLIPNIFWIWSIVPTVPRSKPTSIYIYFSSMFKVIKNPLMLAVNVTVFIRFLSYFGFLTYISFMGKDGLGMSTMAVGIIIAMKSIFSLVGSTQTGRLSNRMHVAIVEVIAFVMAGAGLLVIGLFPSIISLVAGSLLYGIGDGILNAVQKSLVNTLSSQAIRGGAIAISTGIGNLGKALAPPMMALILSMFGVEAIFTAGGVLCGIAVLISFVLWRGMMQEELSPDPSFRL